MGFIATCLGQKAMLLLLLLLMMGFIGFALVSYGSDVVPRFYWHGAQVHAEGCSGLPCETIEKERAA
jgi:hypothetical protein